MDDLLQMNRESLAGVTMISPSMMLQKSDVFTTGIVFVPVGLAHFAAATRAAGYATTVIDAFGSKPNQLREDGEFIVRGLTTQEILDRVEPASSAIFLYAINLTYHRALIQLCRELKKRLPATPLVILENSQAVTAYSLRKVQEEFYEAGADFVLTGEPELRGLELLEAIARQAPLESVRSIDGIGFRDAGKTYFSAPDRKIANLDAYPFPAWDLFPMENYWKLKYSHGPFTGKRYLPILTSRGCPYKCKFCVIPETNDLKWRSRTAKHVVDEMQYFGEKMGVKEFHFEDVDPTVNDKRTREICQEIIRRGLKISWKLVSGTKVETMKDESTVELMAQAGCDYISISPESGSPRVMELMDKSFKTDHAVKLIRKMNEVGIRSQACFVIGYPGEEDPDRELTRKMVHDMTQGGLDEIALFIVTPVPGSRIYDQFSGYSDYSQLNFSPSWRGDFERLNRFRIGLYRSFLLWKLRYHPLRLALQPFNFLRRRFQTKMEMVPYRALHTLWLIRKLKKRNQKTVMPLSEHGRSCDAVG